VFIKFFKHILGKKKNSPYQSMMKLMAVWISKGLVFVTLFAILVMHVNAETLDSDSPICKTQCKSKITLCYV